MLAANSTGATIANRAGGLEAVVSVTGVVPMPPTLATESLKAFASVTVA